MRKGAENSEICYSVERKYVGGKLCIFSALSLSVGSRFTFCFTSCLFEFSFTIFSGSSCSSRLYVSGPLRPSSYFSFGLEPTRTMSQGIVRSINLMRANFKSTRVNRSRARHRPLGEGDFFMPLRLRDIRRVRKKVKTSKRKPCRG